MDKPKIFISSTIYDFSDLRSALKYWLNEMGYNAQLSEYNDFWKDSTVNSYQACLQSVSECDYFILFIGTRKGGMYPGEDISITRKEYRMAYEDAKAGKIKRLIVFIRQSVWDVKEDRKALHTLLKDLTVLENEKPFDKNMVEFYNSNLLKDADHIISFIEEVTRKEEAKAGKMPSMNWIHRFSSFEDVVNTLKIELRINTNLSVKIAEQNVRMALMHNLQNIAYKTETGDVISYYLPFSTIRKKLSEYGEKFKGNETIYLTKEEVHSISYFLLLFWYGIDDLSTFELDNALASGAFLIYDREKDIFTYNNFCESLYQVINEIRRLKRFKSNISNEDHQRIIGSVKNYRIIPKEKFEFRIMDLLMLNSIYERLFNIQNLTSYMIQFMTSHDENLPLPELLNGFVYTGRPNVSDLLNIFES